MRFTTWVLVALALLSLNACSNQFWYGVAQAADNENCMDHVDDENRDRCLDDDQSYDDYQKQREDLLEEG